MPNSYNHGACEFQPLKIKDNSSFYLFQIKHTIFRIWGFFYLAYCASALANRLLLETRARLEHTFASIPLSSGSNCYLNYSSAVVSGQERGQFWFCSAQNSVLLLLKIPLNSVEGGMKQRLTTKAALFGIAGVWDAGDSFLLCAHFLWLIRAVGGFWFYSSSVYICCWVSAMFCGLWCLLCHKAGIPAILSNATSTAGEWDDSS